MLTQQRAARRGPPRTPWDSMLRNKRAVLLREADRSRADTATVGRFWILGLFCAAFAAPHLPDPEKREQHGAVPNGVRPSIEPQ